MNLPSRVEQTSGMNQLQTLWSIAIKKRTSSVSEEKKQLRSIVMKYGLYSTAEIM